MSVDDLSAGEANADGLSADGLSADGLSADGLSADGLSADGLRAGVLSAGDLPGGRDAGPGFDKAFLGYDRKQVDRYLDELTERLDEVLRHLALVDALELQLYQAQLEVERLRHRSDEEPEWARRLGEIMSAAEGLRADAASAAPQLTPPTPSGPDAVPPRLTSQGER